MHVKQAGLCWICREPMDWSERNYRDPRYPTIDHIHPVSRGGKKTATSNMKLAHKRCNERRGNMLPAGEVCA